MVPLPLMKTRLHTSSLSCGAVNSQSHLKQLHFMLGEMQINREEEDINKMSLMIDFMNFDASINKEINIHN